METENSKSLAPLRSRALLSRETSRLVVVDMQEKLLRAMDGSAVCVARCELLVRGAKLLGVPISATEQYPKGLGPTVSELAELVGPCQEKLRFSGAQALDWAGGPIEDGRHQIVVAGLEAHICLLQTALDLIAAGFDVHVPADAIFSRRPDDTKVALQRLSNEGATITTVESVLFEWCETAAAPEFKELSRLVTGRDVALPPVAAKR